MASTSSATSTHAGRLGGKALKLFTQQFHRGKIVQPAAAGKEARSGPGGSTAVVFCHGLMGSCANWHSVAADVSRKLPSLGAAVVVDMRNHGRSPHSEIHVPHTAHAMALDLAHWADTPTEEGGGKGYDRIVLLGHSMGGVAVSTALVTCAYSATQNVTTGTAFGGPNSAAADTHIQHIQNTFKYNTLREKVAGGIVVDVSPCGRLADQFREIDGLLSTLINDIPLTPDTSFELANNLVKDKIKDSMMRGFLLMNLNGGNVKANTAASWKCNLPLLKSSLGEMLFPYQEAHMSHRNPGGIPRVSIPTVHIFGEKSPYNYPEGRAAIHHFFEPSSSKITTRPPQGQGGGIQQFPPTTQIVEMKNGGHYLHYQMKDKFVDTITPWIQRVLSL